jgi:hypothetical protein
LIQATDGRAVLFNPFTLKSMLIPLLRKPKVAQFVKWSVYSLLLVNFVVYMIDDWQAYNASLSDSAAINKILETFSDSIDMAAWVVLVILFELETYVLADRVLEDSAIRLVKLVRVLCYVLVIYAAYGFTANALDNFKITPLPEITDLCSPEVEGRFLQINIVDYEEIAAENCASISNDSAFFKIDVNVSLIGASVVRHVQNMGWVDISNAYVWILVVLLIELEVLLQEADRFRSRLLTRVRLVKTTLYLVLFINAGIWLSTGYPIYAWDAFLWIVGFWAIELNLATWEQERVAELGLQQA